MQEKIKVSAFEYAIREAVEKETPGAGELDKYEPITRTEEIELRNKKLLDTAKKLKIISQ